MKRSEALHLAQIGVVSTVTIAPERKLEVLRHLMELEDLALFCDKQTETKAENAGEV